MGSGLHGGEGQSWETSEEAIVNLQQRQNSSLDQGRRAGGGEKQSKLDISVGRDHRVYKVPIVYQEILSIRRVIILNNYIIPVQ